MFWLLFYLIVGDSIGGNAIAAPGTLFGRFPSPSPIVLAPPSPSSAPTNAPVDVDPQYLSTCGDMYPGEIRCLLDGGSVDIYYWPEPDADKACLDIVGNNTNSPFPGATTTTGMFDLTWNYWGCTAQHPISGSTIITTATQQVVGTATLKQPVVNPWSPQPCIGEAPSYTNNTSSQSIVTLATLPSLKARDHSLVIPSNITQNEGLPVSTVVVENFTLSVTSYLFTGAKNANVASTSPSVYANFHDMEARGGCGVSTVPEVMLSFSPGELSTFAGPPTLGAQNIDATQAFNPADFPCPPQSVMEQNWYMPQPGVPYRPIVAVPQKINNLNPLFAMCEDIFFTALDPPRALVTAPNLVLKPTMAHLQASTTPPMPSRIPKVDPKDNGETSPTIPVPRPAQIPKPPGPQQTAAPGSKDGDKGPGNKDDSSAGSGGGPRKDADVSGNNSPNATESGPLQEAKSKPVFESSRNGDSKQGLDQADSDPTIADGDPRPDAKPKSDPQSNTGTTEDPGQRFGTKPTSQSGTSRYPNRVAAYNLVSGSHSGLEVGDSSDPKDQGHASSDDTEQDSENTQGKNLAIGNHNPGEAATVNGQVAQPLSNDAISIAGTTLTPGASPITISGIEISLGQSTIAVGSISVPIATAADSVWIPGRVTTIDSQPIQPISGNEVSTARVALRKGAPALTVSGTPISLGSNALYIGTNSIPLRTQLAQQSIITVGGQIFTAAPTGFSIAGTSLAPSQAVTVAGTIMSLDASSHLHIGSSTIYLGDNAASTSPQVFTVLGQAFTANPTAVDVAGIPLAPGGNGITVSGRNVSLDSAADLVMDSSTFSIKTSTGSLGGLIMGEINSTRASGPGLISSVSGVQTFRGRAETLQNSLSGKLVMLLMFVASVFAGL